MNESASTNIALVASPNNSNNNNTASTTPKEDVSHNNNNNPDATPAILLDPVKPIVQTNEEPEDSTSLKAPETRDTEATTDANQQPPPHEETLEAATEPQPAAAASITEPQHPEQDHTTTTSTSPIEPVQHETAALETATTEPEAQPPQKDSTNQPPPPPSTTPLVATTDAVEETPSTSKEEDAELVPESSTIQDDAVEEETPATTTDAVEKSPNLDNKDDEETVQQSSTIQDEAVEEETPAAVTDAVEETPNLDNKDNAETVPESPVQNQTVEEEAPAATTDAVEETPNLDNNDDADMTQESSTIQNQASTIQNQAVEEAAPTDVVEETPSLDKDDAEIVQEPPVQNEAVEEEKPAATTDTVEETSNLDKDDAQIVQESPVQNQIVEDEAPAATTDAVEETSNLDKDDAEIVQESSTIQDDSAKEEAPAAITDAVQETSNLDKKDDAEIVPESSTIQDQAVEEEAPAATTSVVEETSNLDNKDDAEIVPESSTIQNHTVEEEAPAATTEAVEETPSLDKDGAGTAQESPIQNQAVEEETPATTADAVDETVGIDKDTEDAQEAQVTVSHTNEENEAFTTQEPVEESVQEGHNVSNPPVETDTNQDATDDTLVAETPDSLVENKTANKTEESPTMSDAQEEETTATSPIAAKSAEEEPLAASTETQLASNQTKVEESNGRDDSPSDMDSPETATEEALNGDGSQPASSSDALPAPNAQEESANKTSQSPGGASDAAKEDPTPEDQVLPKPVEEATAGRETPLAESDAQATNEVDHAIAPTDTATTTSSQELVDQTDEGDGCADQNEPITVEITTSNETEGSVSKTVDTGVQNEEAVEESTLGEAPKTGETEPEKSETLPNKEAQEDDGLTMDTQGESPSATKHPSSSAEKDTKTETTDTLSRDESNDDSSLLDSPSSEQEATTDSAPTTADQAVEEEANDAELVDSNAVAMQKKEVCESTDKDENEINVSKEDCIDSNKDSLSMLQNTEKTGTGEEIELPAPVPDVVCSPAIAAEASSSQESTPTQEVMRNSMEEVGDTTSEPKNSSDEVDRSTVENTAPSEPAQDVMESSSEPVSPVETPAEASKDGQGSSEANNDTIAVAEPLSSQPSAESTTEGSEATSNKESGVSDTIKTIDDSQVTTEDTQETPTTADGLLVLLSLQSFDREVVANQQMTTTVLDNNGVKYDTLDGANADNRTRRNELFGISGIRAKYPQFFLVKGNSTTYWGDWEKFQMANDSRTIVDEFMKPFEKSSPTTSDAEPTADRAIPDELGALIEDTSSLEIAEKHLLILMSLRSFDRDVVSNQKQTIAALDGNEVKYKIVDGADPDNRPKRNELFELSGIRAKYPQFFTVESDKTTKFWGDWEKFQMANENGAISDILNGLETGDMSQRDDGVSKTSVPMAETTVVADSSAVEIKGRHLLVLVSLQSFDREVVANQQQVISMLNANKVTYKTLDGANQEFKTRRNELFEISGIRAKYPQFFTIENDRTTFWGDFKKFQLTNDSGKIVEEFSEPAAVQSTAPDTQTKPSEEPQDESEAPSSVVVDSSSLEIEGRHLLVLISLQSFDREVVANQQQVISVLDANSIKYKTLDGANQDYKARRNELFEISGIRAKYPQFFMVESDKSTTFWGDFEKFQITNDRGDMVNEFSKPQPVESSPPSTQSTEQPQQEPEEPTAIVDSSSLEIEGRHLLVLISLQSFDREVVANQQQVISALDANSIKYKTLDGANQDYKARRNELFEISGIRAKYPQFFMVESDKSTTFWGDFEKFQITNDSGDMVKEFSKPLSVESSPQSTQSNEQPQQEPEAPTAIVDSSSLEIEERHLLVLISLQSFDREVVANQQQVISVLDANSVKYKTLDGANQDFKARRNELFEISGIRAKYPQFFMVESDKSTTFWGNFEKFQITNDRGNIVEEFSPGITTFEPPPTSNDNEESLSVFKAAGALVEEEIVFIPDTSAVEISGKHLLVLVSLQSFDREVVANQQRTIEVLDSSGVNYKTLDGANPDYVARRNELFDMSGIRAKYPQFFIVEDDKTTRFWGDWEKFQSNDISVVLSQESDGETPSPTESLDKEQPTPADPVPSEATEPETQVETPVAEETTSSREVEAPVSTDESPSEAKAPSSDNISGESDIELAVKQSNSPTSTENAETTDASSTAKESLAISSDTQSSEEKVSVQAESKPLNDDSTSDPQETSSPETLTDTPSTATADMAANNPPQASAPTVADPTTEVVEPIPDASMEAESATPVQVAKEKTPEPVDSTPVERASLVESTEATADVVAPPTAGGVEASSTTPPPSLEDSVDDNNNKGDSVSLMEVEVVESSETDIVTELVVEPLVDASLDVIVEESESPPDESESPGESSQPLVVAVSPTLGSTTANNKETLPAAAITPREDVAPPPVTPSPPPSTAPSTQTAPVVVAAPPAPPPAPVITTRIKDSASKVIQGRHLVVLVSCQPTDVTMATRQEETINLLDAHGIQYKTIDGSNPANNSQKNGLFFSCGVRATSKYPQVFKLRSDKSASYWGDWETLDKLQKQGDKHVAEEFASYIDASRIPEKKAAPSLAATSSTTTTIPTKGTHVLVLISSQSTDREVQANQMLSVAVLQAKSLNHVTLDGSDPANKTRANELVFLSGSRPHYPLFFLLKNGKADFWGGWDKFRKVNQSNGIAQEFRRASTKETLEAEDAPTHNSNNNNHHKVRANRRASLAAAPLPLKSPTKKSANDRIALTTDVWRSMNCPL